LGLFMCRLQASSSQRASLLQQPIGGQEIGANIHATDAVTGAPFRKATKMATLKYACGKPEESAAVDHAWEERLG
jgi:hypothetical protein